MNLLVFVILGIIGFIALIFFTSLSTAFFVLMILMIVILAIYKALAYAFNINIFSKISTFFVPQLNSNQVNAELEINEDSDEPEASTPSSSSSPTYVDEATTVPEIKLKRQVFNIPGNDYDFINAKALCKAYGSRLATYSEIEDAYNNGAEWCNYGWSAEQMALFPTQLKSYAKLQRIRGHEHDCGRPGVNGGYISNPNIKFGVNCFGFKPQMTTEEEEMMKNMVPYPKSMEDVLMDQRVDYWKTQINDINVSPFNYKFWSRILTA